MTTAATRAAIQRASQQARNGMRQLDAEVIAQLVQIYQDAAAEVRAAIRVHVDASDTVPVQALRALLRQIEEVVAALGERRDQLLQQGLEQAATLGVRPYTTAGVGAVPVPGAQAVLTSAAEMRIHQEAVAFVRNFTAADGMTLSNRLWRLDQGAKEALTRSIGQAVVQGWDAARAAREFMLRGQPVPADVAARLAGAKAGALERGADALVGSRQTGGEVWKAERVFRTEINRAHGTAYMTGGEQTPGFGGWRYLLSPQHPKPDICDLLAAQNLHGLGRGVYPSADKTPWPAHPNTLSFVEIVFDDEVTAADRAGRETVTEAMGRMAPEVREGILGVGKAELWDEGLVKPWGIRSPLRAVRARLARQGVV